MKKLSSLILTLVIILTATVTPAYAGTTTTTTTTTNTEVVLGPLYYAIKYTDLPAEHWAEPAVRMMSYEGILAGYPDGSFQPNGTVTYGEFIRMATTMTHAVGSDSTADPGRHWAQKYYECGLNCNYYTPYDITEAQLGQAIPRGDMALILAALMRSEIKTENYGNYDTLMGKINDVTSGTKNDTAIIKSYATGALSGYPDGSFRPEG
ncbi:MAG: S-layer homology domain-containing protein, partial [Eubacteriales bacterium]|nr:S-layer homology domain-containing protein [Eubacteriales bacterium]